jgi:hypothetical protein
MEIDFGVPADVESGRDGALVCGAGECGVEECKALGERDGDETGVPALVDASRICDL